MVMLGRPWREMVRRGGGGGGDIVYVSDEQKIGGDGVAGTGQKLGVLVFQLLASRREPETGWRLVETRR